MEDIIDDSFINKKTQGDFAETIKWWEAKRKQYNLIVGSVGLLPLFIGQSFWVDGGSFAGAAIVVSLVWALIANILFSFGWALELFDWVFLKDKFKLPFIHRRQSIYLLGLIFSIFVTLAASTFCAIIGSSI